MYKTYINKLILPTDHDENMFISQLKRYCYGSVYPYKIFPMKDLLEIELAPVTIFYGGNGSGKSTLLNIIAEKTEVIIERKDEPLLCIVGIRIVFSGAYSAV